MIQSIKRFLELESAGGLLLIAAAILALIFNNSGLSSAYDWVLSLHGGLYIGAIRVEKPLLLWVNDLWMAIFFFLVGLEIKREIVQGELSSIAKIVLPAAAAIGGMAAPSLIYAFVNQSDAVALRGWAIPAATDIAFALGILLLLGSRVPTSLKIFLTAVAIIDDLLAIIVIALFYTNDLSVAMMLAALLPLTALLVLNRAQVANLGAYVVVGLILWLCVLKSGVHATLAGVATALAVPIARDPQRSPLHIAEHALHPWVAYGILPAFAFVNAGVALTGMSWDSLTNPITLGIVAGLVIGKPIGIFGVSAIAIKLGWADLPSGATWWKFLAVTVLCGIGFTMSLFIGSLAFESESASYLSSVKLGVLSASLIAALAGYAIMRGGKQA